MTTTDIMFAILAMQSIALGRLLLRGRRRPARPHPMVFAPDYKTWTFSDERSIHDQDNTDDPSVPDDPQPVRVTIKEVYSFESPGPGDIIQRDNMQRYRVTGRSHASYGYLGHQYSLWLAPVSMERETTPTTEER